MTDEICKDDTFNVGDVVYYLSIGDSPLIITYQIVEKSINKTGIFYLIDIVQEQENPAVLEELKNGTLNPNIRVCGKSISKDRESAIEIGKKHYETMLEKIKLLEE